LSSLGSHKHSRPESKKKDKGNKRKRGKFSPYPPPGVRKEAKAKRDKDRRSAWVKTAKPTMLSISKLLDEWSYKYFEAMAKLKEMKGVQEKSEVVAAFQIMQKRCGNLLTTASSATLEKQTENSTIVVMKKICQGSQALYFDHIKAWRKLQELRLDDKDPILDTFRALHKIYTEASDLASNWRSQSMNARARSPTTPSREISTKASGSSS
jgi:hypothetical protein